MGPALSPGAVGQEMAVCAVLGGVLGILFAIPVFSVIYTLLRTDVRARIRERGIAEGKIK